jgi:anti-sigma factor RsiW
VIHLRARRLLPALFDGTLPAPREAAVRAHAERCRRCRRVQAELEACEVLLGELPASLVPRDASPQAAARLGGLARWAPVPPPSLAERLGIPAVGAVAAGAMLALVLTQSGLVGAPAPGPEEVTLASAVLPDSQLLPTGVRR